MRLMVALYGVIAMQAIASTAFLLMLVFISEQHKDKFNGFEFYLLVRHVEFIFQSLVLLFAFKYLFHLKRVEIQMNEANTTVIETLKALKRQMCLEKIALVLYTLSTILILAGAVS